MPNKLKKAVAKLKQSNGYQEIKPKLQEIGSIVKDKVHAEVARNVHRHEEKQQAKAQAKAAAQTDITLHAQPQDHAPAEDTLNVVQQAPAPLQANVDAHLNAHHQAHAAHVDLHHQAHATHVDAHHQTYVIPLPSQPGAQWHTNANGVMLPHELSKLVADMNTQDMLEEADCENMGGFLTMTAGVLAETDFSEPDESDYELAITISTSSMEHF
ncbi:hypothetical protein [Pantoea sp. 18069]|uniref:hypothetical protein n=1 Tax=Pantoea sp. 18069 TaxID=2681415 RepID=UPI0013596A1A|nr:hypothetical protein [Pantoea sp. 18069]